MERNEVDNLRTALDVLFAAGDGMQQAMPSHRLDCGCQFCTAGRAWDAATVQAVRAVRGCNVTKGNEHER